MLGLQVDRSPRLVHPEPEQHNVTVSCGGKQLGSEEKGLSRPQGWGAVPAQLYWGRALRGSACKAGQGAPVWHRPGSDPVEPWTRIRAAFTVFCSGWSGDPSSLVPNEPCPVLLLLAGHAVRLILLPSQVTPPRASFPWSSLAPAAALRLRSSSPGNTLAELPSDP